MKKKKQKREYINNDKFYEELIRYQTLCQEAEKNGLPIPRIPDVIGRYVILIAKNLAKSANFRAYTYIDEMIEDGILKAIEAVARFDPGKSKNPFAYFTQVIYRAFIVRIMKEKGEHNMKNQLVLKDFEESYFIDSDYPNRVIDDEIYLRIR